MSKRSPYIILALVAFYFIAHHAQSHCWGPEFFRFYAKDLLLVPLLMAATSIAMGLFNIHFKPGSLQVAMATAYVAIAFEWVFPIFGTTFVSDPIDLICYVLGAIFYWILLKDNCFLRASLITC